MRQQTLFEMSPMLRRSGNMVTLAELAAREGRTLARPTDPGTSHLAANHPQLAKDRAAHYAAILKAAGQHPGCTSRELAPLAGLTDDRCHKRIAELEAAGLIRRPRARACTVTGHKALVIELTDEGRRITVEDV